MSARRPTPGQAAQNSQTIKSLLKLEANKVCADCKRNKHPRWASWNLGIFICIRCSGIHRGMGTHISRVKSVDLDAWTDEQLQSVIKWGNARANRYWEAKLAPGHVPSDAKIENFIRTKYESKRWVMDGGMPDPSTLDEGDDDVPLAVVQEKAKIERSASQRVAPPPQPARQQASIDLFGDDEMFSAPPRPNTTEPASRAPPPPRQAQPAQQKTHKPADSLLGLDFFGSTQPSTGSRPSSTASTPAAPSGVSRPDLKQSILSLYAKPQPQPQPAPVQHERTNSFGDMASPQAPSSSSNMGALTDAFSGLSFPSTTSPPPAKPAEKPSPFANLTNFGSAKSTPAAPKVTSPAGFASGDLFASLTSPTMSAPKSQSRNTSISSSSQDLGFGGFASPPPQPKPNPPSSSLSNDLFGLSSPPPSAPAAPPKPTVNSPQQEMSSAFNISSPPVRSTPLPKPEVPAATAAAAGMIDPWGGNAWSTPDPVPAPAPAPAPSAASMMKVPDTLTANDIGSGWGAPAPKPTPTVAADEDFGGWTSAAPITSSTTTTTNTTSTKPAGGFGGADDLFSNVWE
ncbi:Arf GTPase activating protein [Penicillium argentinense]|uniref:Arf GTPase activating protein n=1 Tax=Penicillium argentinense TaxID=1131581 RepID=A0A9W9K258_9EURO|nr:Arf GTPase activating protein [Penicillium argentinense]KAJ5089896.1 Arf GTPase activating protein [Penicillium argentinense]